MVRTQVQLTEQQARKLKGLAARRGESMAELIRSAVDALFASDSLPSTQERRRHALAAVGRFSSGQKDVSRRHDHYLAEAFKS
jgi:hypothetical protein